VSIPFIADVADSIGVKIHLNSLQKFADETGETLHDHF